MALGFFVLFTASLKRCSNMKQVSRSQHLLLLWIAKHFSLASVNYPISTVKIHILLSLLRSSLPLACVNFSSNWL